MILPMGTAPGNRQHPAMPDPDRVIDRSLALLNRLGYADYDALQLVLSVAVQVRTRITASTDDDVTWVTSVISDVIGRLAVLHPSHTRRTEITHADGSRGRAGRPEENQQ